MASSNVVQRVVSGVVLALCAGGVFYLGGAVLTAVCVLLSGVAAFEFLRATLPPYRRGETFVDDDAFLYALGFTLIPVALPLGGLQGAFATAVVLVMATLLRELRRFEAGTHEEKAFDALGAIALTLIYPVLFSSIFLAAILEIKGEPFRILIWYVATVALNDIGAWAVGRSIGKTKLAPRTSPGKTCEGAVGGLILALGLALPLGFLLSVPVPGGLLFVFALLISCLGQLGDLVESLVKRLLGVKDMGDTIPGHGGVLDRLDGHLFAAPALFLLTQVL